MNKMNRYDGLIEFWAHHYNLNWRLIKKQLIAESSLDPYAVSPAGAKGLAQFMPKTWGEWGEGDIFNPEESIKACCKYMAFLKSKFLEIPDIGERYKFALASYNAGRGNINDMLKLARKANGLPESYKEWNKQGRRGGSWQLWEIASRNLYLVTGDHSKETVGYIGKIYD